MTSDLNVFKGERSIGDFLDPGKHANYVPSVRTEELLENNSN